MTGGRLVPPETRARVRDLAVPIATGLGRLGLTPNALTLIGFAGTLAAAAAAGIQAWALAGILVVVFGIFDLFDGTLARATGRASPLGAFMDSVFDRAGEAAVYVGVVVGCLGAGFAQGAILAAAAMASAFMVSYTRAKSEGLGFAAGTRMADVGLAPREVRIVILAAGLLLTGPLGARALGLSLVLIALLATTTTIQRIVHVIRQASSKEHV